MNWRQQIVQLVQWKQVIAEADKLGAFPWHFPRVAASGDQIAEAASKWGALAEEYLDFLRHANGWPGFMIATDLFGTDELLGGRADETLARDDVQEALIQGGFDDSPVVPIGATDVDTDVFLLISPQSKRLASGVVWIAGEEIERFSGFAAFFEAMIGYNARVAQKLVAESAH